MFCTVNIEPKNEQNKQTDKCTLSNFFAIYQSPTDHCRGRTFHNQIIETVVFSPKNEN